MLLLLLFMASICQAQEDRALAYLAGEVQGWKAENKCFSCHNNGDGARALFLAQHLGRPVDNTALNETEAWLRQPVLWKNAGENPGVSDKVLAAIQFASALKEAPNRDQEALLQAATILVRDQSPDGAWKVDDVGSPATYGTALATYMARSVLDAAGTKRFEASITKANVWLVSLRSTNVPDLSARLLATGKDAAGLVELQNSDGGWGPWKNAPSEAFDTAIAMIALKTAPSTEAAITRGRAYLLRSQLSAGGWVETTRPSGGQSYAQHISTTAWSVIALLKTTQR